MKAMGDGAGDNDSGPIAQLLQRRFAVGTLGSVRYVAQAMQDMPGRKSLVLFSDGFPRIYKNIKNEEPQIPVDDVRRVADRANRSAVVVYSIDTRGLPVTWLQAQDDPSEAQQQLIAGIPQGRLAEPDDVAKAIAYLASDDASHVTGVSLAVDGGYTAA